MKQTGIVLAWAGDLYLHGHHLLRWITDYVDIEESLAVASIAQEEIAHSAALLDLLHCSPDTRYELIYKRPAAEWYAATLLKPTLDDWSAAVARGFLFGAAVQSFIDQLGQANAGEISALTAVLRAEQQLHLEHWTRWIAVLARGNETRPILYRTMQTLAEQCDDLFGLPPQQTTTTLTDIDGAVNLNLTTAHTNWVNTVTTTLEPLPFGSLSLPPTPTDRATSHRMGDLPAVLSEIRGTRDTNPDRIYPVYE